MTIASLNTIIEGGESDFVEFKKSFSKAVIISLVAFSNAKGGKVIIGIADDRNVVGVDISEETIQKWINEIKQNTKPQLIPFVAIVNTDGKTVVVFEVIECPVKPISYKDKFYKRVQNSNHLMSLSEVANEHLQTINSSWDYYIDGNHDLSNISLDKVSKYISAFENWNSTKVDFEPLEFLNKLEFLNDEHLTYGAYLLFARDLCIISDILIGRFKSETKIIDSLSISTDLFSELHEIMNFIKKHLMVEFIITGEPQRTERYDYPIEAIREIVINMLIHRDYRSSNGSIIKIYDDRIEFYNPGGLFGDLTKEELLSFKYTSHARNKLIAKAFKELGMIEKYGTGIKRIHTICEEYGVSRPEIEIYDEGFKIELFKEKLNGGVNGGVNDVFNYIKNNQPTKTSTLQNHFGLSKRTIERYLSTLRKQNKIEFKGSPKIGAYYIIS